MDGQISRRCAIYTRKSSEEGLEQDFNSLHAQHEACEAYIASQRHEGWMLLSERYDDGGYSGGSMDRPGLERLLADIGSGRIDIVVVYKVDRLTRSLADFARIVDLFDGRGISFVSVTQAFNTTSSMGRLTLNVLLSFAQFEREVTAERIRDKIAASKRKGLWMGGHVPLGYQVADRKLVINADEAEQVRTIFDLYLRLGSLPALKDELDRRLMRTRLRMRRDGRTFGGVPFCTGALSALLRNRVYIGEIIHKDQHYPAAHMPIIDAATFDAVQNRLTTQCIARQSRSGGQALLCGLIFDSRGNRMSPSHAVKNGVRYPYYVSRALLENRKGEAGTTARVSAVAVDGVVLDTLRQQGTLPSDAENGCRDTVVAMIERVEVHKDQILVTFANVAANDRIVVLPWTSCGSKPERTIQDAAMSDGGGTAPQGRDRLVKAIAKARSWLDYIIAGRVESIDIIALRESKSTRNIRMMIQLAFLDPAIIEQAVHGELSASLTATEIAGNLPLAWLDQRRMLGV